MPAPSSVETPAQAAPRAHLFGVSVAMVTPFTAEGAVDLPRFAAHAADVMARGADGMTLYGTTGEGASLGPSDRAALLDAARDAGVAAGRMTVCIAACDLETAQAQARAAFQGGVRRLLLAPPFYFKGIDEDSLFRWVSDFISGIADGSPEVILYHIPQVTGVHFDAPLIRRLKDRFGDAIFGVKDSAGSWDHTAPLLPMDDLAIMIGDERLLARAAPLGGAGAISGMANLMPETLHEVIFQGRSMPQMDALVDDVVKVPVTPLVKALVGTARGETGWDRTRAPLAPADPALVASLAPRVRDISGR